MVAYFCREVQDSHRNNVRKLSRKFEVSIKIYLDSKSFLKNILRQRLLSRKFFVDYFSFLQETDIDVKLSL